MVEVRGSTVPHRPGRDIATCVVRPTQVAHAVPGMRRVRFVASRARPMVTVCPELFTLSRYSSFRSLEPAS